MNILIYFGNQINPKNGGTERVASLVSEHLIKNGHTVYFMACHPNKDNDSVETVFLPHELELPTPSNIEFVNTFIRDKSIDVIINEGGYGDSIYLFSHEHIADNINIISHIHFDPVGGNKTFYKTLPLPLSGVNLRNFIINSLRWIKAPLNKYRFLRDKKSRFKKLLEETDKIVFLKEPHAIDFRQLTGTDDASKLVVIKNPLTFKSETVSLLEKDNTILFVGRLSYDSKRVDRILKVWKNLQSKYVQWNLVIVGDGPDRKRLERICQKYRLERVTFTGKTDSKPYYRKSKLLLMTSNYEGCPMVIPEAMAYGVVPVVMNTFSGSDDVIIDGYNGILCKPFDIKDMVSRIEKLISDPVSLASLSKNAISSISGISNETILDNWLSILP